MPAVLNAANEVAVNAFLTNKISFTDIAGVVDQAMQAHAVNPKPELSDILAADRETRKKAADLIKKIRT
jgi:1-deoxy-D-xylulose-5-phosphate reductoisomerase